MKKLVSLVLSLIFVFSLLSTLNVGITSSAESLSEKLTNTSDFSTSSVNLTKKMLIGYNIGNVFESCEVRTAYSRPTNITNFVDYKENLFGNVKISEDFIKYVKSTGVQAIRLPITWFTMLELPEGTITPKGVWDNATTRENYWYNGIINKDYLARIKEVVDLIIENDMYCIINTHHDGGVNNANAGRPLQFDSAHQEQSIRYIQNIWSQVGNYFKDYGSSLLFEAYNEVADSTGQMSRNSARDAVAAEVLKAFVAEIRSQGGNNAERFLVCPTYGGLSFWSDLNFITDTATDKLIMTKHSYPGISGVDSAVGDGKTRMTATNIGCIVDEIGGDAAYNNAAYADAVRKASDKYQVSCFWWDNGSGDFALFNRYYNHPSNPEGLSNYVGKPIPFNANFTDISQMVDSKQKHWYKFYSSTSTAIYGDKYLIVTSENPINYVYQTGNSMGAFNFTGAKEGLLTYYMSSDDITYKRFLTVLPNTWSEVAWNNLRLLGSSDSMTFVGGSEPLSIPGVEIVETGVKYQKFATAFSAVKDNQTIRFTGDITEAGYLNGSSAINNCTINVDLNGYTYTETSQRWFTMNNTSGFTLNIYNGTITTTNSDFHSFVLTRANSSVNFTDLTINSTPSSKNYGYGTVVSPIVTGTNVTFRNCEINDNGVGSPTTGQIVTYNGATANVKIINTTINSYTKIFDNNAYTIHSGTFNILGSASFGRKTIASTSKVTVDTDKQIVVVCEHNYTDNVCDYCGEVKEDETHIALTMENGAAIRLNNQNGIRFYTNVDIEKVNELRANGYTVELGTLISPKDLLGSNELDFELATQNFADVKFNSTNYFTQEDFTGVVGSIVNIKETTTSNPTSGNIAREFVGRGYAKVTKDGITKIYYASYSDNNIDNNSRSISFVAHILKTTDPEAYNLLTPEQKLLVDNWASQHNQ